METPNSIFPRMFRGPWIGIVQEAVEVEHVSIQGLAEIMCDYASGQAYSNSKQVDLNFLLIENALDTVQWTRLAETIMGSYTDD